MLGNPHIIYSLIQLLALREVSRVEVQGSFVIPQGCRSAAHVVTCTEMRASQNHVNVGIPKIKDAFWVAFL